MNLHLAIWISIYGSLLQCYYTTSSSSSSSSNVTSSDSSILNLVIESSTSTNSDKLLKTTVHNSNDSFSLNNVDTESLHSNSANEECKNGDCTKNFHASSSADNSSSASKILWNLVSSQKSTTQSSVSDEMDLSEEFTIPLYFPINSHSSNNSAVNDTNFYSNDNELDSEINSDNNLLDVHNTKEDKVMNNLFSADNYNFTSTEPTVITTEIVLNELENSEIKDTVVGEATEINLLTDFNDRNTSDILNATEYTTTQNIKETTLFPDDELDFTTYFADAFNSTEMADVDLPDQDVNSEPNFFQNITAEIPYYDSEPFPDNDNSSTLLSGNYDASVGYDELKSKSTEVTINVNNSESHTLSDSDNIFPTFENSENNTSVYPDYETSLEFEELKSKISRMIDIADAKSNMTTFPVISDNSTNAWTDEDKLNTAPSINPITSIPNEIATSHLSIRPMLTSEKYDSFTENKQLTEESATENIHSSANTDSHSMPTVEISWREITNKDSTESTDSTDITKHYTNKFDLNQDIEANNATFTPDYITVLDNLDENSTLHASEVLAEFTETTDLDSNHSKINDTDYISTIPQSLDEHTIKNLDISVPEVMSRNASVESNMESEFEDDKTSTIIHDHSIYTTDTSLNMNVVYLNTNQSTSTPSSYSNSVNEINNLSTVQTNYHSISFDSSSMETSSVIPTNIASSTAATFTKEISLPEIRNITNLTLDKTTENYEMITDKTSKESSDYELNILWHTSTANAISTENQPESSFTPTENFNRLANITDYMEVIHFDKTNIVTTDKMLASFTTNRPLSSEDTIAESAISHRSEIVKSSTTESNFYENAEHNEDNIFSITTRKTVSEVPLESITETDSKHFDTIPGKDASSPTSSTISNEELSSTITETYREGKHIPFSSTLVRRTTSYPVIFNVTAKTQSYPPQTGLTDYDLDNLRYNQIKAEELSPEERNNLINAVVKFSDKYYTKDELIKRMAVIHLWLLHVVADEYKNATLICSWKHSALAVSCDILLLNLSATNNTKSNDIEFENLPQVLYVLPTPEVFLPNISFTFVVHNRWRNETYPADIMLTILNLHTENLKKVLVDIEEIHFSQGLLVEKHDLMSVIIEKYGIILLSTGVITFGMIFLLICIVIYYRKKTRHSAHCLTDDKLHRNMQEAMGIDLNPAVIILQEEIREKAALNGSKVCSLDGDEGWLAPINDVPVEDNNAPFVQDTKL